MPEFSIYIETKDVPRDCKPLNDHEQALAALARFFEYGEAVELKRLYKEVDPEWIP